MISSLHQLPATMAYLHRVGAEPRSLRTAVIFERVGKYWRDLAVIKFNKDGGVAADEAYEPTPDEAEAIKAEFAGLTWPTVKPISNLINPPELIAKADEKDVFIFRDTAGAIQMVQVRVEKKGEKSYIPFSYWSDDQWRAIEPEGDLPLYGLETIKDQPIVFVHEGAKAARHCQRLAGARLRPDKAKADSHPWIEELRLGAHVGWIGGALSPRRTDWSALQKAGVKQVYIVADNDAAGRSAVPKIAERIRLPTLSIQFTDEFPVSFDLADDFPKEMFKEGFYIGPAFRECLHPATWATDLVQLGKGRPTAVLRESFRGMWAYIEEIDAFVCREMPEIIRTEPILNKMIAPFSHVTETCRLIVKAYHGRTTRIAYRPDHPGLSVTFRGSSAINLHVPSQIKACKGDVQPWLDFMNYMFVNKEERQEALRWCATLIARPDIKMGYGLLLISEKQGIGKTTLGSAILAPLVGVWNTGHPSENDIVSDFNDWVAHKRLAIISEIYSGSSWKSYHALKSVITDKEITVNQKYQRRYSIENWCHVLACSNSMRALKMENDDRRWFYPELAETPWPLDRFEKFRQWLSAGGLSIIRHWAESFGDYVRPGARAPMTGRKLEMIEGSRSEAQREAIAVAEAMEQMKEPVAITIKDVVDWCRAHNQGRMFDSDYEIKKAMIETGIFAYDKRIRINQRTQFVVMNSALRDRLKNQQESDHLQTIRQFIRIPNELMREERRQLEPAI